MNQQREIIYRYRDEVLEGRDMGGPAREEIGKVLERLVEEYTPGDFIEDWDLDGLFARIEEIFPIRLSPDSLDPDAIDRGELHRLVFEDALRLYDEREAELDAELMRALERYLLLDIIDQRWREHLYDMDYLREGIHLRGFAQIDPLVAYKNEAFDLFTDLMHTVWADFARMIFNIDVQIEGGGNGSAPVPAPTRPRPGSGSATATGASVSYSGGSYDQPSALEMAAAGAGAAAEGGAHSEQDLDPLPPVTQRRVADDEQLGRNEPCWCGSGKKFKKCHGA
jgi:preprotein translocase subunit SecA